MADRHLAEHEIHHVAHDLAGWSRQHVHDLAVTGRRYDERLHDSGVLARVRRRMSTRWAVTHGPVSCCSPICDMCTAPRPV